MRSRSLYTAAVAACGVILLASAVLYEGLDVIEANEVAFRGDGGMRVDDPFPRRRALTLGYAAGAVLALTLVLLLDRWRRAPRPPVRAATLGVLMAVTAFGGWILLAGEDEPYPGTDIYPWWWSLLMVVVPVCVFALVGLGITLLTVGRAVPAPIRVGTVVLKVGDPERAAAFWTAALGYTRRADPAGGTIPVLEPRDPARGPSLTLDTDDRTHLDLFVPDEAARDAEVERLLALGARRVDWADVPHVVLADPEGTLFCVVVRR